MSERELILRIKAAVDAAGFNRVKDHIKSIGDVAVKAGQIAAVGLAVGGAAAVGIGVASVNAAEAHADAQARLNLVLGDQSASEMAARLNEVSLGLGMSKTQALEAAGAMANYLDNLGVGGPAVADMSTNLTELAPKLAAFSGLDVGQVTDALQKGLGGATRGLKEFGIAIDGDAIAKLDPAAKAAAIYKQILEQSGPAVQGWADNQGDVANSMAMATAAVDNAKVALGDRLLPVLAPLATAFASVLPGALDAALSALSPVLGAVDDLIAVFGPAQDASASFGDRMAMVGEQDAAAAGQGISGLRDEFQKLKDKWDEVKQAFEDGGIQGALEEIVGFDLQPLIDDFLAVGGVVVDTGKFLIDHKGIVLGAAAAYLVFKGALAINKQVEAAKTVLASMKAVWLAYKAGTLGATLATTGFGTALKIAMGPIGWIIMAVGLLYLAWKTNFGGMRDLTDKFVAWIKGVPAMLSAKWEELKAGAAQLARDWSAKWGEIKSDAKAKWDGLVSEVKKIPSKFQRAGRDIIDGFKRGLANAWGTVTSWLKTQMDKLPTIVKKAFKISSPSLVFFTLGRWLMEGFALGIGAGGKLATDQLDKAMAELRDLVEGGSIEEARRQVFDLGERIMGARMAFLTGGSAEPGSLAWLMSEGQWGEAPDFGAVFAKLNIPVADIGQFMALLTRLASEGEVDQVADLWGRFYDSMIEHENAYHAAQMKRIEDGAAAAKKAHEDAQKAMADVMELEKRHFDWVKDQEAQAAAKPGGDPVGQKTKFFSDDVDRIKLKMADALAFLGFEGPKALANFWKAYVGDANASITTTEDLSKAIDAIISEVGKRWSEQAAQLEEQWAATAASEKDRHDATIKMLDEQAKFIDTLIASEGQAQEVLNALIAERDRLLAAAREAIKAAQEAEEERETRIHDGVMANIDAQRAAWTRAHNDRMAKLEAERASQEEFHNAIVQQLQDQRDAITAGFEARELQLDQQRADLQQLKLDLGVDKALADLVFLKDALNEVKRVAESFEIQTTGRADLERQRKAQTERVRVTTDEQRRALDAARATGKLNADQLRTVELLMLGYKQKASDVAGIFAILEGDLQKQVDDQQKIVDSNQLQIDALTRQIEFNETLLSIDKARAQAQIADLEARIKAEDERWRLEKARIESAISAEEAAFKAQMDFLDEVEAREAQRHAQRMSDIAGEYALMLASLGMSQAEIDGIIAAAQALAQSIADETQALFRRIMQDAPKAEEIIKIGGDGEVGRIGGGLSKRIPTPRPEPPPPGIGGEGGGRGGPGLRPKGAVVVEGGASIAEGTIESVALGGVSVEGTEVYVTIDGKQIAAQVVDAIVGNVTITDKLGAALNERAARRP